MHALQGWCAMGMPRAFMNVARKQICNGSTSRSVVAAAAAQQRLYVLDMMPLVYRVLPRATAEATVEQQKPVQQNREHGPTNSFMAILLDLLARKHDPPTHMAVVVDVPDGVNFRKVKYPQYKAHRPDPPPQLKQEVARMLSLVDAVGIPILAVPGVEADDVIGSLAARATRDGFQVVLVSPDKDFFQLLQPSLSILRHPSDPQPYTQDDFQAQHALAPEQWVDVKALAGDPGDNIPGVKGIGVKTALQLVQSLGSVEQVLEHFQQQQELQGVKMRKQQAEMLASADGQAAALFAKQLVTIVTDLKAPPVRQPWSNFELKLPQDGGVSVKQKALSMQMSWTAARLGGLYEEWKLMGSPAEQ